MVRKKSNEGEGTTKSSLLSWASSINNSKGQGSILRGSECKIDPPRMPIGVFSLDYITGGGLPVWGTTCFWGPESSGKTTLICHFVGTSQKMCWSCFKPASFCECSTSPLLMDTYWGDAEGTLDRKWAELVGMDPERYLLGLADYAEQHIDFLDSALTSDDCGVVVLDSLASLTPAAEMEAVSENQFIGLQARIITRAVRKLKQRLITERKREKPCLVVFTNQLRIKIGQVFGNPETMSGGQALKHEFSLLLKCNQKNLKKEGYDKRYISSDRSDSKDKASRHTTSIAKSKIDHLAYVCEYLRVNTDMTDEGGLRAGDVDDYNTLVSYARKYHIISEESSGYSLMGQNFKTLKALKDFLIDSEPSYRIAISQEIVRKAKHEKKM